MSEPESVNTMFHDAFVKIGDGDYALKTTSGGGGATSVTLDPAGNTVKLDQVDPNNRVASIPNPAANSTSLTDTAVANAPLAGNAIATTPNLSVGTWDIECITFISGTTVASLETINMRALVGGAFIGRILNPVPGTTGGVGTGQLRFRYVVTAGTPAASIIAVANATASSVYAASIVAQKVV